MWAAPLFENKQMMAKVEDKISNTSKPSWRPKPRPTRKTSVP